MTKDDRQSLIDHEFARRAADSIAVNRRFPGFSDEEIDGATSMDKSGNLHVGLCWYCGAAPGHEREHLTPLSRGGGDTPENVVMACRPCNARKGVMTLAEYRASLEVISGGIHIFFGEAG